MKRLLTACVNGQTFCAHPGDLLLDAALTSGVDIPHECRSGLCGTCRVRVVEGHVLGGKAGEGFVHACQARLLSDALVQFDEVPAVDTVPGTVTAVSDIATDVVEVIVRLHRPLDWLAGQYVDVTFAGLPPRAFSPTVALDALHRPGEMRFHIQRIEAGAVSSRLGRDIVPGHAVTITGPFGSAFLRRGNVARLVLVASGTGFAPIWAIADAALREWPGRPMVMIAAARSIGAYYMAPALQLLATCPNVQLTMSTHEPQTYATVLRQGPADAHLPPLHPTDVVHVAGSPRLVAAVSQLAASAGTEFHADTFEPAGVTHAKLLHRLRDSFRAALPRPSEPKLSAETLARRLAPTPALELETRDIRT